MTGLQRKRPPTRNHPCSCVEALEGQRDSGRLLAPDGAELGRVLGFKEASELLHILKAARAEAGDEEGGKRR